MVRGADIYCLLLTSHKQTPMHEPHCSQYNLVPCRGLLVNWFLSFLMLSAVKHAETSEKIRVRFESGDALAKVKLRAVNTSIALKSPCMRFACSNFLLYSWYFFLILSFTFLYFVSFTEQLWFYCNFSVMRVSNWIYIHQALYQRCIHIFFLIYSFFI
jgi:hypothetical protein